MAAKLLPDIDTLNKLLVCDSENGSLFWRERSRDMFTSNQACALWNGRYANGPAFMIVNHKGYLYGEILRKRYMSHRIIWKIAHGEEPGIIDHINGIPSDNRISNLRVVDHAENMKNRYLSSNNKTGVNGVDFVKGKYRARIWMDGKCHYLGEYATLGEAKTIRERWNADLGYTARHGERQ